QAEDGIRDPLVTGVQTCALPILRRFYQEVINEGRIDLIDELATPGFIEHETAPGIPTGIEGVKQFFSMFRAAVPDLTATIEDMKIGRASCRERGEMWGRGVSLGK